MLTILSAFVWWIGIIMLALFVLFAVAAIAAVFAVRDLPELEPVEPADMDPFGVEVDPYDGFGWTVISNQDIANTIDGWLDTVLGEAVPEQEDRTDG